MVVWVHISTADKRPMATSLKLLLSTFFLSPSSQAGASNDFIVTLPSDSLDVGSTYSFGLRVTTGLGVWGEAQIEVFKAAGALPALKVSQEWNTACIRSEAARGGHFDAFRTGLRSHSAIAWKYVQVVTSVVASISPN